MCGGKKVKVLVAKLCLTLCDPMDGSSSVHGILQARNTGVDLDLSLLLLVFSLIFTVASRLLHLYSTIDKTSVLPLRGPLAPPHLGSRKSDDRRVSIYGTLGLPPPILGAKPAP